MSILTTIEFQGLIKECPYVILPIGSFEQHGPAASLATDYLISSYLAQQIGERLRLIVLPGIPFGYSEIHINFPGTVNIEKEVYLGYFKSVINSLLSHDVKGIIVVNGHGGNEMPISDYIRNNKDILFLTWFEMTYDLFFPKNHRGHAGSEELSVLSAISSSFIDIEKVENRIDPTIIRKEGEPLRMEHITKNGVQMEADRVDPIIGRKIIEYFIEESIIKIKEYME